jgi:GxxExxY protein
MSALLRAFQRKMAVGRGMSRERVEEIAREVVDAAYHVHVRLGPGLLESVYEVCLCRELTRRGLRVERQVGVPIVYDDVEVQKAFEIDILVEGVIVLELKTVEVLHKKHHAQLVTYLKLSGARLGFLLNFNEAALKDGIKRKALG